MNFADKSDKFDQHAGKLAETARLVATAGSTRNKRTVEAINAAAQQVLFTDWLVRSCSLIGHLIGNFSRNRSFTWKVFPGLGV